MHKEIYLDRTKIPGLKVSISFDDLVNALKKLSPENREEFIENLLAATSPSYINSIREARAEYQKGKVYSHEQVFAEKKCRKKR